MYERIEQLNCRGDDCFAGLLGGGSAARTAAYPNGMLRHDTGNARSGARINRHRPRPHDVQRDHDDHALMHALHHGNYFARNDRGPAPRCTLSGSTGSGVVQRTRSPQRTPRCTQLLLPWLQKQLGETRTLPQLTEWRQTYGANPCGLFPESFRRLRRAKPGAYNWLELTIGRSYFAHAALNVYDNVVTHGTPMPDEEARFELNTSVPWRERWWYPNLDQWWYFQDWLPCG